MNVLKKLLHTLLRFWISISICILILILCFMHTEKLPMHQTTITNFDKFAHLLMFLGLSGTLFFDNTRYLRRAISRRRIVFGSFLFPLLAGGIIEILQAHLTTYRTGDWKDFFFDILGAAAGALIALLINRCLKKPQAHE